MPQLKSVLWTTTSLAFSLPVACTSGLLQFEPAAAQSPNNSVTYLNQAWSQDDREWYYHFSQGSAVLSYDIFLDLEAADSQDLFRSGLDSPRYGLILRGCELIQSGRVADRHQQDGGCDADQGLASRRLRWADLRGVPRRIAEVQG